MARSWQEGSQPDSNWLELHAGRVHNLRILDARWPALADTQHRTPALVKMYVEQPSHDFVPGTSEVAHTTARSSNDPVTHSMYITSDKLLHDFPQSSQYTSTIFLPSSASYKGHSSLMGKSQQPNKQQQNHEQPSRRRPARQRQDTGQRFVDPNSPHPSQNGGTPVNQQRHHVRPTNGATPPSSGPLNAANGTQTAPTPTWPRKLPFTHASYDRGRTYPYGGAALPQPAMIVDRLRHPIRRVTGTPTTNDFNKDTSTSGQTIRATPTQTADTMQQRPSQDSTYVESLRWHSGPHARQPNVPQHYSHPPTYLNAVKKSLPAKSTPWQEPPIVDSHLGQDPMKSGSWDDRHAPSEPNAPDNARVLEPRPEAARRTTLAHAWEARRQSTDHVVSNSAVPMLSSDTTPAQGNSSSHASIEAWLRDVEPRIDPTIIVGARLTFMH